MTGIEAGGMHRALPVIAALLLVLAALAPAVGGQAEPEPSVEGEPLALVPVVGTSSNTTRVLQLDTVQASSFEQGDLSVTNALSAQSGNTETSMWLYAAETRLDRVSESDARRAVLQNLTDNVDARVNTLEEREAAARNRYLSGAITASEYVTVLGEVNAEATYIESRLVAIDTLADRNSQIGDRVNDLQADVVTLTGPVKDGLGRAVQGEGRTGTFFVGVSGNGVALARIDDGTYVREVIRTDARDEANGGVDLDAAQTRIAELYPWAWVNNGGVSIRSIGQDVFRFQLSHDHGSLDSLLDTSSRNVYREIQRKSLDGLPTRVDHSTSLNNTTLLVSDTYAGGPLKVQVLNGTGAPLTATVAVNGTDLGQTDSDGTVWALSPAGTYNVTATNGDVELQVQVRTE